VVQFKHLLGLDTVLLGFGLPEGNAHAPDEFINLDNLFGGMRTCAHFYEIYPGLK
jgi:acetylornithine deacetylase/succinyl-diaminopimelate desuccinylase-like protein